MSDEIREYLDHHAGHGQTVSEGRFTISGERALQKLAEYSVERSEHWVLKWVQAAVAGGARKVSFEQTRQCIEARAWLPEPPSVEDLEASLLRLEARPSRFWSEAVIGIRALLTRGQITVVCPNGRWSWDGEKVIQTEHDLDCQGASIVFHFSPGKVLAERQAWLRWSSQIAKDLAERCRCCPIPVWLDFRQVNSPDARPASIHPPSFHGLYSPRPLAVGWVPWNSQYEAAPFVASPQRWLDPLRSGEPFLFWPFPHRAKERFLAFRLLVSQAPRSSMVKDFLQKKPERTDLLLREPLMVGTSRLGVLCAAVTSTESLPFWGEIVVQADELRSDFSGLALERKEEWWNLLRQAFARLKGPLRQLNSELISYEPGSAVADFRSGVTDLFSGLAAGSLLGFIKAGPVGSVLFGSVGVASAYWYRSLDEGIFVYAIKSALRETQEVFEVIRGEGLTQESYRWRTTEL